MREWVLVIENSTETRGDFLVFIYNPVVFPKAEGIQSRETMYCSHRHGSIDAAKRCGAHLLAQKKRLDKPAAQV